MDPVGIEIVSGIPDSQLVLQGDTIDDSELRPPKKRAETWGQEEIRALISLRGEMERYFGTSKSNRHLWDQIAARMKELGFDRNANMCTDKWRNLLKEHKKAKQQNKMGGTKLPIYKELDVLLTARKVSGKLAAAAALPKIGSSTQGASRPGRVVTVKYGNMVRKIGVDASEGGITENLRACFGLRNRRPFWLEDESGVVRPLSKDMPTGSILTLVLDPGINVKICEYDEADRLTGNAYDKVFYVGEDLREFMGQRGWLCLREMGGYRDVDNIEDLTPGAVYHRGGVSFRRQDGQVAKCI